VDIWGWVRETAQELHERGDVRLAQAFYQLPEDCNEGRHQQVDGQVPEALASARALGLPWVEVFLRHWHLQSRVAKRREGEVALGEAVALLEFAHREDTAGCPQSVCAVQDFVIYHGAVDGPGYVPERLAVLTETLERIDPSWSCFDCLTTEYADALVDDGRTKDALEYLREQRARIRAAGGSIQLSRTTQEAGLLRRLGRLTEALELLDRAEAQPDPRDGDDDRLDRRCWRALILADLGRLDEARAVLPPTEAVDDRPSHYQTWADAALLLVEGGAMPNDWVLGRHLSAWVSYLGKVGSHWHHLELALVAGRLATARTARWLAGQLLDQAEQALAKLRRPELIEGKVAALRAAVAALPPVTLPVPAEALAEHLRADERPDPEVHADLLRAAVDAAPDDRLLSSGLGHVMAVLGYPNRAAALLQERVARDPEDSAALELIQALLEAGDDEGVERLATTLEERNPVVSHWALARLHAARDRWRECAERCAMVVALDDGAIGARMLWARALRELGDFPGAQARGQEALERAGEDDERRSAIYWQLVVDASGSGDWATVRQAASRLGMELEQGDGPIDERWGLVRLAFGGPGSQRAQRLAVRTGPATARLLSVARPGTPHNFGDLVLFLPEPLEPPAEPAASAPDGNGDAEQPRPERPLLFPVITTLEAGGFTSHILDGADPGEERWHAFADALRERGYGIWVYSDDSYVLNPVEDRGGEAAATADGEAGGGAIGAHEGYAQSGAAGDADGARLPAALPGVYAGLAVPPDVSPQAADALLTELTSDWPHPMTWLDLATAAGADLGPHHAAIKRYAL
jgi:tetratricopeptide (TPR) repeat protein